MADIWLGIKRKQTWLKLKVGLYHNLLELTVRFGLVRSRILNPSVHDTLARTHVMPHLTKHDPSDSGASLPVSNEY